MKLNECFEILKNIHQSESVEYDGHSVLTFDFDTNSGEYEYDIKNPYGSRFAYKAKTTIGVKDLVEHMSSENDVSDDDMIWCLWQLLHEMHHDKLHSVDFMQKNALNDVTYMAQVQIASDYDNHLHYELYNDNPSEIYADLYAITKLPEICNEFNMDAKEYIVKRINSGKSNFVSSYCHSYEEALNCYEEKAKASFGKYDLDIVCKVIAQNEPKYFRGYQCIKYKYCKGQNFKGKVEDFTSKKILHIIPQEFEDITSNVEDQDSDEFEA